MTIRKKVLTVSLLSLLLPFSGIVVALSFKLDPRIGNSRDGEIQAAAIAAGEVYQQREQRVLTAALVATQQIAPAMIDVLSPSRPIPGASSRGAAATEKLSHDSALDSFAGTEKQLRSIYPIDFIIITDTQGRVLAQTGGIQGQPESWKDKPVVRALVAEKNKLAPLVSSVMESRKALQPLVGERGKIDQASGALHIENGLVIEAAAPVLNNVGGLMAVVITGYLVNYSAASPGVPIANEAKQELKSSLPVQSGPADVSIAFQTLVVSTTLPDGRGSLFPSSSRSVQYVKLGNNRYLAGSYPIKNHADNSAVIGHIVVTEPEAYWRNLLQTIGWPALIGFAASFFISLLTLAMLSGRIGRDLRHLNEHVARIGVGDFDEPIDPLARRDEIGELSTGLERLRVSVKQAIERLRRRTTPER